MATFIHFDIRAENVPRAKEFYEKMFDWKFEVLPGPMNYYLIETQDLEGNSGLGGGMAKRENTGQTGITNYICVNSVIDSLEKVKALGGKVIQPREAIPGWGYLAVCLDTENNPFGLFEKEKNAG